MGDLGCKVPLCQAVLSCSLPSALPPDHQVTALSARACTKNPTRCAEKWRLGAVHLAPAASSIPGAFLASTCQVADVCSLAVSTDGGIVVEDIATALAERLRAAWYFRQPFFFQHVAD